MTVTHTQYQPDYDAGRDATVEDVNAFGVEGAANKWRMENPIGQNPTSLAAYYYAKAGLDFLATASRL